MKGWKVGCVALFVPFSPWRAAWHLWQVTRLCPQAVSWGRCSVPLLLSHPTVLLRARPTCLGPWKHLGWGKLPLCIFSLLLGRGRVSYFEQPPLPRQLVPSWRWLGMLQGWRLPAAWPCSHVPHRSEYMVRRASR